MIRNRYCVGNKNLFPQYVLTRIILVAFSAIVFYQAIAFDIPAPAAAIKNRPGHICHFIIFVLTQSCYTRFHPDFLHPCQEFQNKNLMDPNGRVGICRLLPQKPQDTVERDDKIISSYV